jgi:hypothetical protein
VVTSRDAGSSGDSAVRSRPQVSRTAASQAGDREATSKNPWISPSNRRSSTATPASVSAAAYRLAAVLDRTGVVPSEPAHVRTGEEVAVGVLQPGWVAPGPGVVEVDRRVDQELSGERRPTRCHHVAPRLGDDRREVAARAVASDREPVRVAAELEHVVSDPPCAGEAVLDRRRNGSSGARRQPRLTTTASTSRQTQRHGLSWVSRSPITNPPPWRNRIVGRAGPGSPSAPPSPLRAPSPAGR